VSTRLRRLDELDHDELAVMVREYLLAGQLMDRAGMPHLISAYGRDVMGDIAIDEWMGASPVYTRRTQRLLDFVGDDIETLFKCLQIDIGAPPEFMDFRLKVIDEHHGEFWLDHCGALMDVEPMGDDYVQTMCHTIEDPTFDATAMAVNARARIRPIHRPPRTPVDRHPHCHWTATIDESIEPLTEPEPAVRIATTLLAQLDVPTVQHEGEGWHDYRAPQDPDLRFEMFSTGALRGLLHEIAVQTHLLVMSFNLAVERRYGTDDAVDIGAKHFAGSAGLSAERLRDAFGLDRSLAAVAQVLLWHPAFQPSSYTDLEVVFDEAEDHLELRLSDCTATQEPDHLNWMRLAADGHDQGLTTLVQGIDLHYSVERLAPAPGELAAWRVVRTEEPAKEASEVALTRFSTGATFEFSETPVQLG
jgi:hypothetical protein